MIDYRSGARAIAASALGGLLAAAVLAGPGAALADRPMNIVGSTFLAPYVQNVVGKLVTAEVIMPPKTAFGGTGRGVSLFCQSATGDGPDVVAMSRRIRSSELDTCFENGVTQIIEIQLGMSALVLVARRDDADYNLSLRQLYSAVAAELPDDGEFLPNRNATWKAVSEHLPDLPLKVMVPAAGLGSRGFFEDRFLEAACRKIPDIKGIFAAEERVRQCISLRRDGVVGEIGLPYDVKLREAMTAAAKGTIAVAPLNFAQGMTDIVKVLPLDGFAATPDNIADRDYEFVRPLYVYVKRTSVKNYKGEGEVNGLREFITELTREQTIGPEGYLVREGLVPLRIDRREQVRRGALSLRVIER